MNELLERINNEMKKFQEYYNKIEFHLYPIITACFQANGIYVMEEEKTPAPQLFERIDQLLMSIEDDVECLNTIYSMVVTYLGDSFVTELSNFGEGRELATLTPAEALVEIAEQLKARQAIDFESLVALRTLNWVRGEIKAVEDLLTPEKEA